MSATTDMNSLLDTTRRVSRILQGRHENLAIDYDKIAKILSEAADANVYIMDLSMVLGWSWVAAYDSETLKPMLEKQTLPASFFERINNLRETSPDLDFPHLYDDDKIEEKYGLLVPIYGGGERLGTLLISRVGREFLTVDFVLAEYLATIVGIEILHDRNKRIEAESRERLVVKMAMGALSYSEVESVRHILKELGQNEGVVVASKIADRVGVTRSVIVNALRKLEGAGVIESRSLGMKGTHIKLLVPHFLKELGLEF